MSHSEVLSNNPYPESVHLLVLTPIYLRSNLILSSHLLICLPKVLVPVDLSVKIVKVILSSSILTTLPAHLNLLDYIE